MGLTPNYLQTSDGFRIAWYELGGGDGAPPIVLQHGYTATTASEWVSCGIAERLSGLGRRIIGVDALGHGASDKPHESRHYGERRMARDISELMTALEIGSFDLVGYSMGAVVATIAASIEPRIRRLAIGGIGEAMVLLGGVDTRALSNLELATAMRASEPSMLEEPERSFRMGAEQRGNDLLALAAQADAVNATPVALDRIAAPALLIAGDADPLAAHPRVLARAIPNCRLVIVPGDHVSGRLSPEFSRALVDFLR